MKKYLIFIISFILLFSLVTFSAELLSGLYLTSTYTPDMESAWNASAFLSSETTMSSADVPFAFSLLMALLSATGAHFIAQKFTASSRA